MSLMSEYLIVRELFERDRVFAENITCLCCDHYIPSVTIEKTYCSRKDFVLQGVDWPRKVGMPSFAS